MKLTPPRKIAELGELIKAKVIGDPNTLVSGFNEIHKVENGDLTFVDVQKYYKKSLNSAATVILINQEVEAPEGKALLLSQDPFRDYNFLTEYFQPRIPLHLSGQPQLGQNTQIGSNVVFGRNVKIGSFVEIGHNVVIGSNVTIGDYCLIYPNVSIYDNSTIGKNVCIQSGSAIGSEAFYYKKRPYGRDKLLSKGRVILENYVEIGANTTIDRGVSADTIIGEHTKIDNLVQIGHDVIIGKRCIIAAQVGIAGVSKIEDDVVLWGQVGIPSDVTIGKGAVILAKSGVISSLEGGKTYFGFVAKEWKKKWRELACLEKLPDLLTKLENL